MEDAGKIICKDKSSILSINLRSKPVKSEVTATTGVSGVLR